MPAVHTDQGGEAGSAIAEALLEVRSKVLRVDVRLGVRGPVHRDADLPVRVVARGEITQCLIEVLERGLLGVFEGNEEAQGISVGALGLLLLEHVDAR